jgi:lipid-A-disaccharide synthase-like uncharacterized protein
MFEILGVAGIAISAIAYVPQVVHLAREHCSAGVSNRAWTMWLTSGFLVGLLAVQRGDAVFILLQITSLTSAALILFLSHRFKGMACETHMPAPNGVRAYVDVGASQGRLRANRSAQSGTRLGEGEWAQDPQLVSVRSVALGGYPYADSGIDLGSGPHR